MTIDGISPATLPVSSKPAETPERVHSAASQFEALLLAQMLRQMRSDGGGWLGSGEDQAGQRMVEVAEEQFAQALASQGGLGLASMVVRDLNK